MSNMQTDAASSQGRRPLRWLTGIKNAIYRLHFDDYGLRPVAFVSYAAALVLGITALIVLAMLSQESRCQDSGGILVQTGTETAVVPVGGFPIAGDNPTYTCVAPG